jgi:RNA polymerase sigma-70 factor (ECF subfamily)
VAPERSRTEGFAELAAQHLDAAYNLARWLVRDPTLADDVVQDAMLRALKYFGSFRGDNARAWLLQIVRNAAFARLSADAKVARTLSYGDAALETSDPAAHLTDSEPEASAVREQNQRTLDALLAALPVELRECLVLRELEELSYKEIARVIDAPVGTVMSRLWRARRLLAQHAGATLEAVE